MPLPPLLPFLPFHPSSAFALVPLKSCLLLPQSRRAKPQTACLKYHFLRELQIGVPSSGGVAWWAVVRVPGLAGRLLPSCCVSKVGSKKDDASPHQDTNPILRASPSWTYLTQICPQGLIFKHHPTGGLGFSSQQNPGPCRD